MTFRKLGPALATALALAGGACSLDVEWTQEHERTKEVPINDTICFSDDAGNLKVMDVKTGVVSAAPDDMKLERKDRRCVQDSEDGVVVKTFWIEGGLGAAKIHRAYVINPPTHDYRG